MTYFYVATPYSKYQGGRESAHRDACAQTALLIKAGVPVYSPIAMTHPIAVHSDLDPLDHELWLEADRPMMRAAKGLIVCKLQGWDESYGVEDEIKYFRDAGKPIVYMEPGVVPFGVMPKERQVIGLCGFAGSGKDEAAKALVEDGWLRVSFADALREALRALDPVVQIDATGAARLSEVIEAIGWDAAKKRADVRRLLQSLGTEAGRNIHGPNCWVDIARRKIDAAHGNVVITDVRFPNECALIREYGGTLIKIERNGVGPVNGHVSEQLDAQPDLLIRNDGTVDELHEQIRSVAGLLTIPEAARATC